MLPLTQISPLHLIPYILLNHMLILSRDPVDILSGLARLEFDWISRGFRVGFKKEIGRKAGEAGIPARFRECGKGFALDKQLDRLTV